VVRETQRAASSPSSSVGTSSSAETLAESPNAKGKTTKGFGAVTRSLPLEGRFGGGPASSGFSTQKRSTPHPIKAERPQEVDGPTPAGICSTATTTNTSGQQLMPTRRLTSLERLALNLKPPLVVPTIRSVSPDRPVWTHRKRERGGSSLDTPPPPAVPSSSNNATTTTISGKKESHVSGSCGKKELGGVGIPVPEPSSKRRKTATAQEKPLSEKLDSNQGVDILGSRMGTHSLPSPAVQINEISSSSETEGNPGEGERGRHGKGACRKTEFRRGTVPETIVGRKTRQSASCSPVLARTTRKRNQSVQTISKRKTSIKVTSPRSNISQQKSESGGKGVKNFQSKPESRQITPKESVTTITKGKGQVIPKKKDIVKLAKVSPFTHSTITYSSELPL